jgi:hypothetical protein
MADQNRNRSNQQSQQGRDPDDRSENMEQTRSGSIRERGSEADDRGMDEPHHMESGDELEDDMDMDIDPDLDDTMLDLDDQDESDR